MRTSIPERRWLAAILLLGLLLRLAYLLEAAQAPDFDLPRFEAQYHDYWARALVSGDWSAPEGVTDPEIRERPYFRPPGYPFFLAAIYQVFGPSYWAPRLVQMALGLASCWLVWLLARRPYGAGAALGAAAVLAGYWVLLFFEAELMAPVLIVFLLLAVLLLASRWIEGLTIGSALGAGALVGLLALVRPNALLLPLVLLGWMAWLARQRPRSWWRPAAAFSLAVVLVVLPATWRNWRVAKDPVLVTSNAGINLFVGNHPDSDGYTPGVAELVEISGLRRWESFDHPLIARAVERLEGRPLRDSEVSSYFVQRLRQRLAQDASHLPGLWLRKLALFWGPAEVSNNKVLEVERQHSRVLRLSPGFATLTSLAAFGLVVSWRRRQAGSEAADRRAVTCLMVATAGMLCASYLPFFVAARFRLVVVPVLAVFAGCAVAWFGRQLSPVQPRKLLIGIALLAVTHTVAAIAWMPYTADESLWHFRRALLLRSRGDLPAALAEASQAVAAEPAAADPQLLEAELLVAQEHFGEAAIAYGRVLQLRPGAVDALAGLALVAARRGDLATAVDHWHRVLQIQPDRLPVLNNLALALATAEDPAVRDPATAVELAERANRLSGGRHPGLQRTLEIAYRAAGREAEADSVVGTGVSPRPPND